MRIGFNSKRHYKKDDTSHGEYLFLNTDLVHTVATYIWVIFQMFIHDNSDHIC